MDDAHFDRLTRRYVLGGLAAALGLGTARLPDVAHARKRKKVKFNAFGCVDVGRFCKKAGQCCSGICQGKKGKKKCRAHDADICSSGDGNAFCNPDSPNPVACTTSTGNGVCRTTTGNAGFCVEGGDCFPCTKDAECVPFCGAGAACFACAGCPEGTACGSPSGECVFP
jgi:hypothetical protein